MQKSQNTHLQLLTSHLPSSSHPLPPVSRLPSRLPSPLLLISSSSHLISSHPIHLQHQQGHPPRNQRNHRPLRMNIDGRTLERRDPRPRRHRRSGALHRAGDGSNSPSRNTSGARRDRAGRPSRKTNGRSSSRTCSRSGGLGVEVHSRNGDDGVDRGRGGAAGDDGPGGAAGDGDDGVQGDGGNGDSRCRRHRADRSSSIRHARSNNSRRRRSRSQRNRAGNVGDQTRVLGNERRADTRKIRKRRCLLSGAPAAGNDTAHDVGREVSVLAVAGVVCVVGAAGGEDPGIEALGEEIWAWCVGGGGRRRGCRDGGSDGGDGDGDDNGGRHGRGGDG